MRKRAYTIADVPLPWSGKRYQENEERVRSPHHPCCICGTEVTSADAVWLAIGDGNSRFIHPSEPQPGDVGAYPIGRSCLKKYPALRALGYVHQKTETTMSTLSKETLESAERVLYQMRGEARMNDALARTPRDNADVTRYYAELAKNYCEQANALLEVLSFVGMRGLPGKMALGETT